MRKLIDGISLLAASLLASGTAVAADRTIAEFESAQQAAWNAHDAAAYAAPFDRDAEIVTALGWHWTGQAEAAGKLGDGFKLVYAHARLRLADVRVRMLTAKLAAVTLSWSIDGARTIDGGTPAGPQTGFETQLLQRQGEGWLIVSQQDTAVVSRQERDTAPVSIPAQSPQPAAAPAPSATTFPVTPPPVRRCIVGRANGQCLIYGKPKPNPAP